MTTNPRLTALAAAAALLALPAVATARVARFTAAISGAQTTKWTTVGGSNGDCKGIPTTKGEGTEVYRFDSGKPEKVLATQAGSAATSFKYGTWDQFALDQPLGFLGDFRNTRHGSITTHWSGGYCGHPPDTDTGPYDCGKRRGTASIAFDPYGTKRILVEVSLLGVMKAYRNCPITTPSLVTEAGFTSTYGRFSNKLIFGKRKRIVVEDGKVCRLRDAGVSSTTTTHFRLVLTRVSGRTR